MTTIEDVVLTRESRKRLRKIKYWSFGNVADTIECATSWWIPEDIHEYSDLKETLERHLAEFFELEDPDAVEIKSLRTNILSFHKGVYPDYSSDRKATRTAKNPVSKAKSGKTSGSSGPKTKTMPRKGKNAEN